MEYGISELSRLAGISTRTLRYYDEIGLLRPSRVNDAGYRYYGEQEVDLLWRILFYRERGLELKQIRSIVTGADCDVIRALEEHLAALREEKQRLVDLISTVSQTIQEMKGEINRMSDAERFQVLKKNLVQTNEEAYGEEIRKKYGEQEVEASNRHMMHLTQEEYDDMTRLGEEILDALAGAVKKGGMPRSDAGKQIAEMHKRWLLYTWTSYSVEAHRGVAQMYVQDERFRAYYDRQVPGCAEFLRDAVLAWCGA